MHYSCIVFVLFVATLATKAVCSDPIIYIKNNSNRAIHIQPYGPDGKALSVGAQFIEPQGEYIEDDVTPGAVKGIWVKYCKKDIECRYTKRVYEYGTVVQFEFERSAKKYYLKLDIDENDVVSLEPQKGRMNRTANMKWSLSGNISGGIVGPTPVPSASMNVPSVQPQQRPARPQSPAPTSKKLPATAQPSVSQPSRPTSQIVKQPVPDKGVTATSMPEPVTSQPIPAPMVARPVSQTVTMPATTSTSQLPVDVIEFQTKFPFDEREKLIEKYVTRTFSPEEINAYTSSGLVNMKLTWSPDKNIERAIEKLGSYLDWGDSEMNRTQLGGKTDPLAREELNAQNKIYTTFYYYYKLGESNLLYDPNAIAYAEQIKKAVQAQRDRLRTMLKRPLPSGRFVITYLDNDSRKLMQ